jgi:hypothetical protein
MNKLRRSGSAATRWWIPIGAVLFLIALTVSAIVVPELRLLHALQALLYVAIIVLGRRANPLGLGAGITIALVWNGLNLFVTHLFEAGAVAFWSFLRTGHIRRLDTMMVPVGVIAHFVLIIASVAALLDSTTGPKKWQRSVAGGLLALAYFAVIIIVARPK